MNIVVFIKHTVDVHQKIKVKENGKIHENGLDHVISACDECAIEEAVRIRENHDDSTVTLVCMGPADAKKSIRRGLSLGADRAIHLLNGMYNASDATANALVFAGVLKTIPHDLVLMGKQAQDTDMQATGEILSGMLGLPMASNCVKVDIRPGAAVVHRQADRHLEVIELGLPCIITVNNDINNPRYPSVGSILAARIKPIARKKPTDFVDENMAGRAGSLIERVHYETPPARPGGKLFEGDIVESTNRVIELLASEARVIG